VAIEGGPHDVIRSADLVIGIPEQSGLVNFLNDLLNTGKFGPSD
jgi:hypothetical protein